MMQKFKYFVSSFSLQLAKDHSAELASQLELLKSQKMGGATGDHTDTTGNSLFGEVDDRRINIERKMISLRVKHESLERTHSTTLLQLKKMKASGIQELCSNLPVIPEVSGGIPEGLGRYPIDLPQIKPSQTRTRLRNG